jgi:urease accessory protein
MSLKFSFNEDKFSLQKLNLPSRYYYFNDNENYIKLLNIGEGIFPKDKIRNKFTLNNSSLIITTESATKIYPSKKEFALNYIDIKLKKSSNLEFINDELILYKDSKFIQIFRLDYDENSTFFYGDILSSGRSFENFDFCSMKIKNLFTLNKRSEYKERFDISGDELKSYIQRKQANSKLFAKMYIKLKDNEEFLKNLEKEGFFSFTYSKNKSMIIGVLSHSNMADLKRQLLFIWTLYRKSLNKNEFHLGKQ